MSKHASILHKLGALGGGYQEQQFWRIYQEKSPGISSSLVIMNQNMKQRSMKFCFRIRYQLDNEKLTVPYDFDPNCLLKSPGFGTIMIILIKA